MLVHGPGIGRWRTPQGSAVIPIFAVMFFLGLPRHHLEGLVRTGRLDLILAACSPQVGAAAPIFFLELFADVSQAFSPTTMNTGKGNLAISTCLSRTHTIKILSMCCW